mgnify:CR=1 FL=1
MGWTELKNPLYPWMRTVDRILSATRAPVFSGPTMVIASDSGGTNSRSNYRTWVHLCMDLEASKNWEPLRRDVRQRYLPDGRRLSYKALGDEKRKSAIVPFLEAAESIVGVCVAVIIDKRIRRLCLNEPLDYEQMHTAAELKAKWKDRELEEALRVTQIVAGLIAGLSLPKQNIYWISDQDNLFGNDRQSHDVSRLLSSFSTHYMHHSLGELGIGTTALDEGDRLEEDLTAIPDLVAGALAETTTRLSQCAGGYLVPSIAIPYEGKFLEKADLIANWFWAPCRALRRVAILFALQSDGRYSVSKHEMRTILI